MKVLFAVNSESISEAIIKKYQKDYREILSYKNVYYFNAIQKEIQQDKSYDRIVISEDLEPFSNNNYESIDKFIFEKLDGISDEAHDTQGNEISIILICSDRHTKSSSFLVKLFGIGVYNALLGNDRSMEEVCRLINKPRTKKEAKMYYKIDTDDVNYRAESEDEVSELEIQNILSHFKKLGKNSQKYVSSFENIAGQYTDEQLKIIINCLPITVKAVLEQNSEKYQEIMSINGTLVQGVKSTNTATIQDQKRTGLKIDIIENKLNQTKMTKPIVIPSSVKTTKSTTGKKVMAVPQNAQMAEEMKTQQLNKAKIAQPNKVVKRATESQTKEDLMKKRVEAKKKAMAKQRMENSKTVQKRPVQGIDDDILLEKAIKPTISNTETKVKPKTVKPVRKVANVPEKKIEKVDPFEELEDLELPDLDFETKDIAKANIQSDFSEDFDNSNEIEEVAPVKKGRGRPRKNPVSTEVKPKGKRGRPRKVEVQEELDEELPDLETISEEQLNLSSLENEEFLPEVDSEIENDELDNLLDIEESDELEDLDNDFETFEDDEDELISDLDDLDDFEDDNEELEIDDEPFDEFDEYDEYGQSVPKAENNTEIDDLYNEDILSLEENEEDEFDFDMDEIDEENQDNEFDFEEDETDDTLLSEFDDDIADDTDLLSELDFDDENEEQEIDLVENESDDDEFNVAETSNEIFDTQEDFEYGQEALESINSTIDYSMSNLNSLMTKDKKIVTFLGSPKNGVSFLVNNLAELFASVGINVAILDMTQNKNSYYIYTQNEENLRKIAYTSIEKLQSGVAEGIRVKQNLTVYTALPNDGKDYSNAEPILSTLVQNHSLVLIDCDFATNPSYFASAQEIYLVQSMDILTIQPLTAFLRELMTQGVLEPEKVKVVINKELKVRGLTNKAIIGGMSFYNDPAMSFMTELFNKDNVNYCSIPFEEAIYSKYLEAILNCKVSMNGYSKNFMSKLRILGDMVYPLTSRQTYAPGQTQNYSQNNFSSSMNNTLNKMKKKF